MSMTDFEMPAGVGWGDTMPTPGFVPPQQGRQRNRWPDHIRREFERMGPQALVVVGTEGPVSLTLWTENGEEARRIGGNKGCWPLKLATTASWKDTVTTTYNRSPFFWIGSLVRVWCESDRHERLLAAQVMELLSAYKEQAFGETLVAGYIDVGPNLGLEILEMEIHAIAERLGFSVWDDDGLEHEIERRALKRMRGR